MSLSKSEQARINGAKSNGPATNEGKTRSAQNSTKHGFFAKTVCISTEDKDAFEHFRQDYFDRYNPIDEPEINLVEKIVCAVWRQHRLWDIERVLLEKEMHETDPAYSFQVPESTWRLANAFTRGQPISDALDRLYKIESHFDRMAARSDRTLRLLQKTRPPAGSVTPPSPPCLCGERLQANRYDGFVIL